MTPSKVTICPDTFQPSTWTTHDGVEDVRKFLYDHFNGEWPQSARIYLDRVARNSDITPYDNAGVERLGRVTGHFYVVVYPAALPAIVISLIVSAAITAVSIGLEFLLRPPRPTDTNYGETNRGLSQRTNQARVGGRIPDIYGEIWAYFDLLQYPYKTFVDNIEYEHCFMCVGRGSYQFETIEGVLQIRDDTTPFAEIDNASAMVYNPYNQPGNTPDIQVGPYVNDPLVNLTPFSGVNGQIVNAPNNGSLLGNSATYGGSASSINFRFLVYGGYACIQNNSGIQFTDYFNMGDIIMIGGLGFAAYMQFNDDIATDPSGSVAPVHLGSYNDEICFYEVTGALSLAGTADTLQLNAIAAAEAINPGWSSVAAMDGGSGVSEYTTAINFVANGQFFQGPFWLNYPDMDEVWANFVCPESIYLVNASTGVQVDLYSGYMTGVPSDIPPYVSINLLIYPCDVNGNPTAGPTTATCTTSGNLTDRLMKGVTLKQAVTPGPGGVVVIAQRTNMSPGKNGYSYEDQVQWRDLYIISTGTIPSQFGNVTTIQTVIPNTPAALAIRERKANALVTRIVTVTEQTTGTNIATATDVEIVSDVLQITLTGSFDFEVGDTVSPQLTYGGSHVINFEGQITAIVLSPSTIISIPYTAANLSLTACTGSVAFVSGQRPSTNAADILCTMALDPYIGNLLESQIDTDTIYSLAGIGGTIQEYFAMYPDSTLPTQFCYSFEDSKVSFEESVTDLATSIFCVGYRRSGLLSLSFEQETNNSTLLFNHRNKLPKSETRTITFGSLTQNDGINLEYVEPNAPNYPNQDTPTILYFPTGPNNTQIATNPKRIKTVGIRNASQATVLGWRLYWKLMAQNTATEFQCTEEAALSVLQDRVLIADNTRPDTQDGEVVAQSSLLLTLSQDVTFLSQYSYTIFLQHPDETVESIPITAGGAANEVLLAYAPNQALVISPNNYANTTYIIVSNAPSQTSAFLIAEKTPAPGKTYKVKAVNYSPQYYQNDGMFATNVDVAALVTEVVTVAHTSNVDVGALTLEAVEVAPTSNFDAAALVIEVVTT